MRTGNQASSDMKHIVIATETFTPEINGVANTLQHLCHGLMQRGHRVSVVRPRQQKEARGPVAGAGTALFSDEFVVTGLPLPGYPDLRLGVTRTATLRKLWRHHRPDAIYVATQGPLGIAAVNAAQKLGIPVISGFHTNFQSYSKYYRAGFLEKLICGYGRWFHNRTAITLVPTRKMAQTLHTMARGLAVVSCDDAATSGHIRQEENRMKAALDDDSGFIDNALKLADQPTLLNRIRAQARLDALDLNWHLQIEQFEQLVLNTPQKAKYHAVNQSFSLL